MSANRVRIIGGAWRSRLIEFPPHKDLRPTPDRVRETLFNWLGQDLTGATCLDLFAGSGVLGFEAASRGARRVVMVERDPATVRFLAAAREALRAGAVELARADALRFLAAERGVFDVIFLDPPYAVDYWPRLAPLLPARLAPGGLVYHERGGRATAPAGWKVRRQSRAGRVNYQLLEPDAA
ncbi:MAG: 16S rRNA (guanine(966)-N(2))-methyltransferase RsmD [Burkholderiales bacterium]|nr:16S rRNA (guanine(966)-N(2))-methyltransferase RsmD [Burkholderiales bacterium]